MNGPVLVTGAQGFLGRYLVAELLLRGEYVIGLGRSPVSSSNFAYSDGFARFGHLAPLPAALASALLSDRYSYVACDLSDADGISALVADLAPRRVVHLAGALRDEPWPVLLRSNVIATVNFALACAALTRPPLFILGSTGSVYGEQPPGAISEMARPHPIGGYATSKLMAELAARDIGRSSGMPTSVARIFNLLGAGLQQRHLASHLAQQIAEVEAGRAPPLVTLGKLSTVRDFIDVRDAASALSIWPDDPPDIVNLAWTAVEMTHIVATLLECADRPIALAYDESHSRPGADHVVADTRRLLEIMRPQHDLSMSLLDVLEYARSVA